MYPLFTAEQALAFPPPNYDNPKTRGNALTVVDSVFLAVALIFLLLRLYTRLFVRKWFGWDDVFICLAFVCILPTFSSRQIHERVAKILTEHRFV
jgi:hypothetical protein